MIIYWNSWRIWSRDRWRFQLFTITRTTNYIDITLLFLSVSIQLNKKV